MPKTYQQDALQYHALAPAGKIEVVPTKPMSTQLDLALAYSPGVAEPCLAIAENPDDVYQYTAKGNLVAVITNGTAVLGLGNIGPAASKPVMEGKAVLFKKFAGIDCFDLELDASDPDEFIRIVKALEPTFGGINLEDIKAPECFRIEAALREQMRIPLMHDDQHGTAIITSAALLNALEIVGKRLADIRLVVSGAGAAAIACLRLYLALGLKPENVVVFDKDGVIHPGRTDLGSLQMQFATSRPISTLAEAMAGADVFLGLSAANVLPAALLLLMAERPIVFALANPDPEIAYDLALATRPDLIMATGRSDYPNQVNNVLGFPYIFRGALDVRATEINEAMKLAAVHALAQLARDAVPELVNRAYGDNTLAFGPMYLIPKPLDPRLITTISPAVAQAAMESGVARRPITDWPAYQDELRARLGVDQKLLNRLTSAAKASPRRVVFADGDSYPTLKAAQLLVDEGIAHPILLGHRARIAELAAAHSLDLAGCTVIDIREEAAQSAAFAERLFQKRQRKGVTRYEAQRLLRERNYYAALLLDTGQADAVLTGLNKEYGPSIAPYLRVIGPEAAGQRVAGLYLILHRKGPFFFADTTVNINPTAEELVDIVGLTARRVRSFGIEPRVALISYSNFGSTAGALPDKMRRATELAKARFPDLLIDGEMQANVALNPQLLQEHYCFSPLAEKGANTLIFPNVESGNIAYKVLQEVGGAEVVGPILLGLRLPVHILQVGASVREIVHLTALAVVDAQQAGPAAG